MPKKIMWHIWAKKINKKWCDVVWERERNNPARCWQFWVQEQCFPMFFFLVCTPILLLIVTHVTRCMILEHFQNLEHTAHALTKMSTSNNSDRYRKKNGDDYDHKICKTMQTFVEQNTYKWTKQTSLRCRERNRETKGKKLKHA